MAKPGGGSRRALIESMLKHRGLASQVASRIPTRAPDEPVPLSFPQERIWCLQQVDPDHGPYTWNDPMSFRFRGRLDVAALQRTLHAIARRHEPWRSVFSLAAAGPIQTLLPATEPELAVEDLGRVPASERRDRLAEIAAIESRAPFDLVGAPPVHLRLVRIADDDHVLLVTMHQIIVDGWTDAVVLRELTTHYEAFAAGGEPKPPELPIGYSDFSAWQRTQNDAEQLEWWSGQLHDLHLAPRFPSDRPRPAYPSYRGARHLHHVDAAVSAALRQSSRAAGATLFMSIMTGLQILLAGYSGQSDVVVGTGVANRSSAELSNLIGYFVNVLLLRGHVNPERTFQELLADVRASAMAAFAHQDAPFQRVIRTLAPARQIGRTPLVSVLLVVQNHSPSYRRALADLQLEVDWLYAETSKFDVVLEVFEQPTGLLVRFEYDTDLFDATTIEAMARDLDQILTRAAADPAIRVEKLLPRRETSAPADAASELPPATASAREPALLELARRLLPSGRLERDDDFFAAGGYSLLAIQFVARANAELGVASTVRAFLEHPTIAAFARKLDMR